MNMEEKNKYIENYIRDISLNINKQYGKELIDEDKIKRAIDMFKDSPEDLETSIIPNISKLASKIVRDFLEFQKHVEEMMEKAKEEPKNELATLDLGTDNNGIFLNQQQVDLLMITEIKTPEELYKFVKECGQFPDKSISDVIPDYGTMNLEDAKRKLYEEYQKGLVGYLDKANMNSGELARVKLEKLGIQGQELDTCISYVKDGRLKDAYTYLGQNHGNDFITRLNRYMLDDFENVKPVSYDEMVSLSELIKNDYSLNTIVASTGNYGNVIYQGMNGKIFDPYLVNREADYCAKYDKHMRYHALIDHMHLESLISSNINLNGRNIDQLSSEELAMLHTHKQEILGDLKQYIALSMDNIATINKKHPDLIKQVEVFNELVERNKTNKNSKYEMVWEKYFGITIDDIIGCFPKDELGNIIKPNGIEFIYSETMLTESLEKRNSVEKTLFQIEKIQPGIIDTFGDQMHTSSDDVMTEDGRRNLTETAQMLKRIQDGTLIVDGQTQIIQPKKTECMEHDHHFTKEFLDNTTKLIKSGMNIDLWAIKREHQRIISGIYNSNGVRFDRNTYWALFGQTDHNKVREDIKHGKEVVKTMFAGLVPDGKKLPSTLSINKNVTMQKSDKNVMKLKLSNNDNKQNYIGFASTLLISIIAIILGIVILIMYNFYK